MSNENVTVLTDEIGLLREYNEVKRKANVGERIKIVAAENTYDKYHNGDVFTVDRDANIGVECDVVKTSAAGNLSGYICDREYVVLAPSDIVRIGSGRYRLEQRKANVGERVVVLHRGTSVHKRGDILTITEVNEFLPAQTRKAGNVECGWLNEREYRVLVPLADEIKTQLSAKPAQEQRDDIVANLAARVSALESEIATLKRPKAETLAEKMSEAFAKLSEAARNITPRTLTCGKPSAIGRDDVIERAKRDVAELPRGDYETKSVDGNDAYYSPRYGDRVNFVINRDKRTVVALLEIEDDVDKYRVWARGIAKCAPDDVFNVHIGKALSLRRALALPIPDEYVTAPKPTEARVGDVIIATDGCKYVVSAEFDAANMTLSIRFLRRNPDQVRSIIDDSREETEVSA